MSLLNFDGKKDLGLVLYGLGLLGAKRRNQADRYIEGIGGILQDRKEWERGEEDRKLKRELLQEQINQIRDPQPDPTTLQRNLSAAGLIPGTPDYQKAVMNYLNRPLAPQITNIPALPAGYQYTYDENQNISGMKMIEGGPAEQQAKQQALENQMKMDELQRQQEESQRARQEEADKRAARDRETIASIDNTLRNIREGKDLSGFLSTGIMGKLTDWVPGTPAYNLAQKVVTIKSNIGFDKLQRMRELSPTGGALGQVAVQELNALQNNIDALEPGMGESAFDKALTEIDANYMRIKATIEMQNNPEIDAASFGELTDQGLEVFDSTGALIGYFD